MIYIIHHAKRNMIILGLNGGYKHDASACIVIDGQLISYAEEERFCKTKHAIGKLPICSILHCLCNSNITINDVDLISTSWIPDKYYPDIVKELLSNPAIHCRKKIPVINFGHHISHLAAAYYVSGNDRALVISVDGSGENISTTIAFAEGKEITVKQSFEASQSLGYFYTGVGIYLGFDMWDEGKLMGLASYGEAKYEFPIKLTPGGYEIDIPHVSVENITNTMILKWIFILNKHFGKQATYTYSLNKLNGNACKKSIVFNQVQKDIAASAQVTLENTLLHLIKYYTNIFNCKNVVLTGGVALNCSANGKINQSGIVDDLFIMPAPNDAGTCIGAAMLAAKDEINLPLQRLKTPYWGSNFSNEEISDILTKYNIKHEYTSNIDERAAELLTENKIIGWFQGNSEMGPRALGNRSIIANPINPLTLNRVNREIKFRENWRPLAPSILDDKKNWLSKDAKYSPYMLKAFYVNEFVVEKAPAIVHVDRTTRPQTVRNEDNGLWYKLIKNFYQLTGVPQY